MKTQIIQTIQRTIRQHQLPTPPCKIVVAISGGADSVCLLLLMKELGYSIVALHCNFHLRGAESDRDETFVRNLCKEQGIPLHTKDFDTSKYCHEHGISIEMGARELRYSWFEEMLINTNSQCICVAHNQQDQAETLLLNLLRGSGMRGLAAMHYKNGNIVRPLLDITRQQIEDYLKQRGQTWQTDSTNLERDAIRNRIRLDILPLLQEINPQAIRHIAETASHVQESLPYFETASHAKLKSLEEELSISDNDDHSFRAETLTELYEVTRHAGFTSTQLNDIFHARTGAIIESSTYRMLRHNNIFVLRSKKHNTMPPELVYTNMMPSEVTSYAKNSAYFDSDTLKQPLAVRRCQNADRMQPFGMKGTRLISDIMTDLHLNRFEKEDQYVLVDASDNILWLIGHRASAQNAITPSTRNILKITLKEI